MTVARYKLKSNMDINTLFTFTPVVVACIPVTVGLVAVIKNLGLDSRYAPVASILVGIGLVALSAAAWQVVIAQGLIVGLAASGLWSGTKATFEG